MEFPYRRYFNKWFILFSRTRAINVPKNGDLNHSDIRVKCVQTATESKNWEHTILSQIQIVIVFYVIFYLNPIQTSTWVGSHYTTQFLSSCRFLLPTSQPCKPQWATALFKVIKADCTAPGTGISQSSCRIRAKFKARHN